MLAGGLDLERHLRRPRSPIAPPAPAQRSPDRRLRIGELAEALKKGRREGARWRTRLELGGEDARDPWVGAPVPVKEAAAGPRSRRRHTVRTAARGRGRRGRALRAQVPAPSNEKIAQRAIRAARLASH
jgi:hypothetical protein